MQGFKGGVERRWMLVYEFSGELWRARILMNIEKVPRIEFISITDRFECRQG